MLIRRTAAVIWRLGFGSRGRGISSCYLETILGTSPERGPVWRVGGPRARVRRAEWWVGGPRTRERVPNSGCGEAPARLVASDSVFFMSSGWSARVQQRCGNGS
jgi:hypothetical protein